MNHIKVIDPELGEVPYVDRYGRVTYYYAELAGRKIWLYQPGTIMFESGVKEGDLKVCSGGSQQNGPILGNGCAAFLCKFVVDLIEQYEKIKKEEENTEESFVEPVYCKALTASLNGMAEEDFNDHGRLLVMKDQTCCMIESGEFSDQQNMMFYVKDLMHARVKATEKELTYAEIVEKIPSEEEIVSMIVKRHESETVFNHVALFLTGMQRVSKQFPKIIE
jgi:hypothetical protein